MSKKPKKGRKNALFKQVLLIEGNVNKAKIALPIATIPPLLLGILRKIA
jgi:hypothetical protein